MTISVTEDINGQKYVRMSDDNEMVMLDILKDPLKEDRDCDKENGE